MSTPMTRGQWPKALWPGINTWWGLSYKMPAKFPQWKEVFYEDTSTQAFEEDVSSVPMGPAPEKPEGSATEYFNMKQGYVTRYDHLTYSTGYIISQEAREDMLYPKLAKAFTQQIADSVRRTEEIIASNILNRAFTAGYTYGDGKTLIATDHPLDGSLTTSNTLAYSADLSEASIESLIIQINGAVDSKGNLIGLQPRKLIVPRQLQFQASRILQNPDRPGTADRDINALYKNNYLPEGFFCYTWLQLPTAWFIMTDVPENQGMKRYTRIAANLVPMTDKDFDTDNLKVKARVRFSVSCSDTPHAIYGVQGAA